MHVVILVVLILLQTEMWSTHTDASIFYIIDILVTTKTSEKKINEVDISQKNWIVTTISICSRKDQEKTFFSSLE